MAVQTFCDSDNVCLEISIFRSGPKRSVGVGGHMAMVASVKVQTLLLLWDVCFISSLIFTVIINVCKHFDFIYALQYQLQSIVGQVSWVTYWNYNTSS